MNPLLRSARIPMNALCFHRNFAAASSSPLVPVPLPSRLIIPMFREVIWEVFSVLSRETHLWYVVPDEVKSLSFLNRYSEILVPSEKEYTSSVRGERFQKTALLARVLVRTTIARYQTDGPLDPRSLRFRKNTHGKPEEAYVKALGKGFSAQPFRSFTIRSRNSRRGDDLYSLRDSDSEAKVLGAESVQRVSLFHLQIEQKDLGAESGPDPYCCAKLS